jgi:transposase
MAKRFSEQFKQETVAYAMANKTKSTKELALTLGIGHSTLSKWLHRAGSTVQAERSAEQLRIDNLEKEVAHLREVNEILKKAHVYFVNNPSR